MNFKHFCIFLVISGPALEIECSIFDRIPFVSQIKSLGQVISGDSAGARQTQQNFANGAPIISQLHSAGLAISGDKDGAKKLQQNFLKDWAVVVDPNSWQNKWRHWSTVSFVAGDILNCNLLGFTYHVLLATSSKDVIHLITRNKNTGYVGEESWIKYHKREGTNQEKCMNVGSGLRSVSVDEAIRRAREDKSKFDYNVYYDLIGCNCEHWVTRWATNKAPFSKQVTPLTLGISGNTDKKCAI